MATRNTRRLQHDSDYARGNGPDGDRVAVKRGWWGDRDANRDLAGNAICTHWGKPAREHFAMPNGKVPRLPFRMLPWSTISQLRTPEDERIRTIAQALRDAHAIGMEGVEIDFKYTPSRLQLWRLRRVARKLWGAKWNQHVEVKQGYSFEWRKTLKRAHSLGYRTTLIGYPGSAAALKNYPFVDMYRRP